MIKELIDSEPDANLYAVIELPDSFLDFKVFLPDLGPDEADSLVKTYISTLSQIVGGELGEAITEEGQENYMFRAFTRRSDGKRLFNTDPEHPFFNPARMSDIDTTLGTAIDNIKQFGVEMPVVDSFSSVWISAKDAKYSLREFFIPMLDPELIEDFGRRDVSILLIYNLPENNGYMHTSQGINLDGGITFKSLLKGVIIVEWKKDNEMDEGRLKEIKELYKERFGYLSVPEEF